MEQLKLNFISLVNSNFEFTIYLSEYDEHIKDENIFRYRLPDIDNPELRKDYNVSFQQIEGLEERMVNSYDNIYLTKKYLLIRFYDHVKDNDKYEYDRSRFHKKIIYIISINNFGKEIISIIPHFLHIKSEFGYLINFQFKKDANISFNKEVQRYSLSLNQTGNENINYYYDKYKKIQNFLSNEEELLKKFSFELNLNFFNLDKKDLSKKQYAFQNNQVSTSQFNGLKNFGPYLKISNSEEILYVFIFEDKYKNFANTIYLCLKGVSYPGTFPGVEKLFSLVFGTANIRRIELTNYTSDNLKEVIQKLIDFKKDDRKIIGIYIEPNSEDPEFDHAYNYIKYNAIKNGITIQSLSYKKMSGYNVLKWATSSIALQIFAKLGGIPWILKSNNSKSIILGIGSAHKKNSEGVIQKYFSYTVSFDSSGRYKYLSILSESKNESEYLKQLKNNLIRIIQNEKDIKECIIHIPYKIRNKEIDAIQKAITGDSFSNINFKVIKINLENDYFAISNHNTLVPHESSYIKLSNNQFLVWFDGLQYGKENITRRPSNPVHIEFLDKGTEHEKYLQDVINLSGANWRGFNAKQMPISIFYAQLVARFVKDFNDLDDFDIQSLDNSLPWFL